MTLCIETPLTAKQVKLLRTTLGAASPRIKVSYKNHVYVSLEDIDTLELINSLVSKKYMRAGRKVVAKGKSFQYFHVLEEGAKAVGVSLFEEENEGPGKAA